MATPLQTKIALDIALDGLKNYILADYKATGFNQAKHTSKDAFEIKVGSKFLRLFFGGSIWCFLEKKTGDIYMAATYKAPAKKARGNVYDPNTWSKYSWCGPHYLK
jgi:hypothetical protein